MLKELTKYQEVALTEGMGKYRKVVHNSVKKGIEGNGIRFDIHLRQEAYSEAYFRILRGIKTGNLIYIPGFAMVIHGSKKYPLRALLCKIARREYYRLIKKNNTKQVISLDSDDIQEVIKEQDNYKAVQGRTEKIENALFRQFCSHVLDETDNLIIEYHLQGYTTRQIAGELKSSAPTISRRITALAHYIASEGITTLPKRRASKQA